MTPVSPWQRMPAWQTAHDRRGKKVWRWDVTETSATTASTPKREDSLARLTRRSNQDKERRVADPFALRVD